MADNMMGWKIREAREQIGPGSIMMDDWELKKLLGKGSFGDVWLAEKDMVGIADQSAIKIIRIPHDPEEIDAMHAEGFSDDSIRTELHRNVENAVREIRTMLDLQNHPAIVPYKSFDVIQYEEDESWDIDIRMQLLTSLPDWLKTNEITSEDVIRMGTSLTDLLSVCEKKSILHRDIKPANIFVDKLNNFKLGDFGLARVVSGSSSAHSKGVGTEAFMAPEVFSGDKYDHRADIYSLGLVMYWLLNHQSLPFTSKGISRSGAISLRLSGEPLPSLPDIDPALDRIIRKACDPNPKKRWNTAQEFHDALLNMSAVPIQKPEIKKRRIIFSIPIVIILFLCSCILARLDDITQGLFFLVPSTLILIILEKTGITCLFPPWQKNNQRGSCWPFWIFTIAYLFLNLFDSCYIGWGATGMSSWAILSLISFIFFGMFPLLALICGMRGKRKISLLFSIIGFVFAVYSVIIIGTRACGTGTVLWLVYPLALLVLIFAVILGKHNWMLWIVLGFAISSLVWSILLAVDALYTYASYPDFYISDFIQTWFYNTPIQIVPISRTMLLLAIAFGINLLPLKKKQPKRNRSSKNINQ